jgi:ABC-2 type transport system ATP-binding protein
VRSSSFSFQNVSKRFDSIMALDDISLEIPTNSIFGLLGPNGSGKSTLMRILAGLIKSWDGSIHIKDKSYNSESRWQLKNFGFLIEAPSFYEYLSAYDNLKIFSRLTNSRADSIDNVLRTVNLFDRKKDKVKTYSYGMKQRLGLAQSLLHDPDFLILDEPNNGLDPAGVREMSRIINKLQRNGKTICVSTHILSEVDTLCTHAAILKKGKQIASVELDDKYHNYNTYLLHVEEEKTIIEKFKGNNDFELEKIDKNSIILRTSLDNALNTLRKMNLNESGLKHITKQSNLVRYFNA